MRSARENVRFSFEGRERVQLMILCRVETAGALLACLHSLAVPDFHFRKLVAKAYRCVD